MLSMSSSYSPWSSGIRTPLSLRCRDRDSGPDRWGEILLGEMSQVQKTHFLAVAVHLMIGTYEFTNKSCDRRWHMSYGCIFVWCFINIYHIVLIYSNDLSLPLSWGRAVPDGHFAQAPGGCCWPPEHHWNRGASLLFDVLSLLPKCDQIPDISGLPMLHVWDLPSSMCLLFLVPGGCRWMWIPTRWGGTKPRTWASAEALRSGSCAGPVFLACWYVGMLVKWQLGSRDLFPKHRTWNPKTLIWHETQRKPWK